MKRPDGSAEFQDPPVRAFPCQIFFRLMRISKGGTSGAGRVKHRPTLKTPHIPLYFLLAPKVVNEFSSIDDTSGD